MGDSRSKVCIKCGERRGMQQFHKNASSPDGHFNICKECRKYEWGAKDESVDKNNSSEEKNAWYGRYRQSCMREQELRKRIIILERRLEKYESIH